MPFADREEKLEYMRDWRAHNMRKGYGKWLYQRRKLRFDDAERFRVAIDEALALLAGRDWEANGIGNVGTAYVVGAATVLHNAMLESRAAEEALGSFVPQSQVETLNL